MPKRVWSDDFYVECYLLARQGVPRARMPEALGVPLSTFKLWHRTKPALRNAIKKGRDFTTQQRGHGSAGERFFEYVYKRLPSDLQDLWDKLDAANREKNAERRIEALLENQGKATRQRLFVHAVVMSNWNMAEACRLVNISYETWEAWKRDDPDFVRLLDNVRQMQKDFITGRLMDRVDAGDTAAIKFAATTINRDRGFDPKLTIQHQVSVLHQSADLEAIIDRVSPDAAAEILKAIREVNAEKAAQRALPARGRDTPAEPVEDAEILSVGK